MFVATSDSMTQQMQDARASLKALAQRLRLAALDVIWRQWRAVGAQAATKGRAHAMVDPEALVLLSLMLMDDERRLADLVHGWATWNSDLLSVQRAKNLAADYPKAARDRLTWFARIAFEEGKDIRWRSIGIRALGESPAPLEAESLRVNKARAVRARLAEPAALLLRLRLGFGVGAKADVLGFLLGIAGEWATVREIATATAYTVAGVRRAAEDMAAARLIHAKPGPPTAYRVDFRAWSYVLGLDQGPTPWQNWHERFAFVAAFLAWAKTAAARPLSPYAFGVNGRELLEQHRPAFERGLVAMWSEHSSVADWGEFVTRAVGALAQLMVERT